jgi:hypothetical protein
MRDLAVGTTVAGTPQEPTGGDGEGDLLAILPGARSGQDDL